MESAASKLSCANSSAVASPTCQRTCRAPAKCDRRSAMASMAAEVSTPTTAVSRPAWAAARKAPSPVVVPRSSTVSRGSMAAIRTTRAATGISAGTT